MEHNDPSRRPYAQYPYTGQQSPQGTPQSSDPYTGFGGPLRQSTFVQQSPGNVQTGAQPSGGASTYGFAQSPSFGGTTSPTARAMPYGTGLQTQEVQRQQGVQQYPEYGSGVAYGMAPPALPVSAQQVTQSLYEQASQYAQRPVGASDTFANPFPVSRPTGYYLAPQALPTTAPASELSGATLSGHYQPSLFPTQGISSAHTLGGPMPDPSTAGTYGAYASQAQYTGTAAQPVDQAFNNYQHQIYSLFMHVRDGMLSSCGGLLLSISQYLLGNVESLGLTRDDEPLHDDRVRLWDEFNRAWLVTLQRQVDMTQEMLQTGQALRGQQSLMNSQTLEHLSEELLRLCDGLERFGLVDYQMGVAEDEIMDIIIRCLSLLSPPQISGGDVGAQAETAAQAARRGRR